jgi:hypothetical protein
MIFTLRNDFYPPFTVGFVYFSLKTKSTTGLDHSYQSSDILQYFIQLLRGLVLKQGVKETRITVRVRVKVRECEQYFRYV